MENEWITWSGGERPVAADAKVNLRTVDPDYHSDDNRVFEASSVDWEILCIESDVKEYRIVSAGAA